MCVCVRARARNQRRDESIVSLISKKPERERAGYIGKADATRVASTVASRGTLVMETRELNSA